jgi:sucrose-6F-phosphate phosphohydrolase
MVNNRRRARHPTYCRAPVSAALLADSPDIPNNRFIGHEGDDRYDQLDLPAPWNGSAEEEIIVVWTLASDIDGTLTGDREALDRLTAALTAKRQSGDLFLILCTGRRLDQVTSGMAEEGLPEPDAVICQVGTEIYLPPLSDDTPPMREWRERLLEQYSRQVAESFLDGIEGLRMQPDMFNTDLKTSCYVDECPDPDAAAAEIRRRAADHGDAYLVVYSSGRDLDILPAASGKGKAIRFLVAARELDDKSVLVAGDTGNDIAMFEQLGRGVVVANAKPELIAFADLQDDTNVYRAEKPYAAGVEEGLVRFGLLDGR